MTIRGGGSPRGRDDAGDQAHPLDDDWEPIPAADIRGTYRHPSRGGGGGGGLRGLLRFLVFSLVLAAVVLVALVTVLRPLISGAIVGWASDNPSALGIPFVADMVRDDLGKALTDAPSTDGKEIEFVVAEGDTARTIATRLQTEGFLTDLRAFVFTAIERSLTDKLEAGTFILRKNLTPDQLVTALLQAKDLAISLPFREGLRLEQVVAKLETLPVTMDVEDFYNLVKHPSAAILAAHPWLVLPKGASLEGLPGSGDIHGPAGHHAGRTHRQDARHVLRAGRAGPGRRARRPRHDVLPDRHAGIARGTRVDPGLGTAAHRRCLPEPAQSRALPARQVPVGRDRVLRQRFRSSSPS